MSNAQPMSSIRRVSGYLQQDWPEGYDGQARTTEPKEEPAHGMKAYNDRGPSPLDVGYCHVHTVEVESQHDARCDDLKWTHEVSHPFKGYVLAQVFNRVGDFVPLPGAGRTWKQQPNSILIPVVHENNYPIMVVMAG